MFDRFLPGLKWLCLALAGMLVYQGIRLATGPDPLAEAGLEDGFALTTREEPRRSADAEKQGSDAAIRPGRATAPAPPKLPDEVQARVEQIESSGLLGQAPRPLPMALLGIGGEDAFLRTSTGQSGLLRVGEKLGEVKLLRIGINHVVVEVDGQEQELQLFPGLGDKKASSK